MYLFVKPKSLLIRRKKKDLSTTSMRATSEYIHILHPLTLYELPIVLELSFIHCSIHLLESNIVLHLLVRGCQLGWALEHFKSLTSEHWKNILCWYYRQPFTLFAAFGQILNISHDPFCCKRIMFKALFTNAPICFPPPEGDVCWWSTTHCPLVYPRMWC